jgi:hypothetical protein
MIMLSMFVLQGCVSKVQFEDIHAMVIDGNHLRYVSRHYLEDADSTFGHTRYRTLAEQTEVYLIPLDFSKDIEVSAVALRPYDDNYWAALYNPKTKTLASGKHVMAYGQGRDGFVKQTQQEFNDDVFNHHLFNGEQCQVDLRGWVSTWQESRETYLSQDGRDLVLLKKIIDPKAKSKWSNRWEVRVYRVCQLIDNFVIDKEQDNTLWPVFAYAEREYPQIEQFSSYGISDAYLDELKGAKSTAWDKTHHLLYWLDLNSRDYTLGRFYRLNLKTKQLDSVGIRFNRPPFKGFKN